jgi:DNA-binding GntR family transcriptional regulator
VTTSATAEEYQMTDPTPIGALRPLVIADPRSTSLEVHAHLRRLIIDSVLPPGAVLKQAELARAFEVSRTPMREAFRMLQEEGLIDADPNQRARVRGFDPVELDLLYATRITLESLGCRLTAGRLTAAEAAEAREGLDEMERARVADDAGAWIAAHHRFHGLCMARTGEPLVRTITSYAERSERYLRLYRLWHPRAFTVAHGEHLAILEAVERGDATAAGRLMARHLSRTALVVLGDLAAGTPAHAIDQALAMATASRARPVREG